MSSPLLPEFDGPNLRIILPAGVNTIEIEGDVYSQWKEWFKLDDNSKFPPAFRTVGGDPLTPGVEAGAYFFIQNQYGWRIRPPEEDSTILITGNLAPEDSAIAIAVPTLGGFTSLLLGLQPVTQSVDVLLEQQQDTLYGGAVHINTITGQAGTSFPIGTATNPVNNLADAITLATNLGVSKFFLTGFISLTEAFNFWTFEGSSGSASINLNGQDVGGSFFKQIGLFGSIVQPSPLNPTIFSECEILSFGVTGFVGSIAQCVFSGTLTCGDGDVHLFEAASKIAGTGAPVIDKNNLGGDLSVRGYLGGVELRNVSQGNKVSFDLTSGRVILAPSVTSAEIVVRGVGTLTNNSVPGSPFFLDSSGLVSADSILYKDEIYIDTNGGGTPGTLFPQGTSAQPVDNLADAITIANEFGITTFNINGSITLTQNFIRWKFVGSSNETSTLNPGGFSCGGSSFFGLSLEGNFAAIGSPENPMLARECRVTANHVTGWVGTMVDCLFAGDTTLQAGRCTFVNCSSEVAGTDTPVIDRNSTPQDLNIRGWIGGLEIQNFNNGDNCSVDLHSGHLILGPTNTSGTLVLRGVGHFTNNLGSPQVSVVSSGFVSGLDIRLIKALTGGDAEVSLDDLTVTIYDPDVLTSPRTVLATYSISADGRIRTRTS